ncbi:MAG: carbonic anhydrase [Planctomycetota bacterium]
MSTVRAGALFAACLCLSNLAAQTTAEEALGALRAGNARFVQDKSLSQTTDDATRRRLAQGQHPFAMVITCADSRVPPEHVFDTAMGELFVIRVAGNVCDREVLASMEYAVEHLDVSLGVVLGHEGCGAVKACAEHSGSSDEHDAPSPAITGLLRRIEPALQRAKLAKSGSLMACAEEENVYETISECVRNSDKLRRRMQEGKFKLAPARYRLLTGAVEWLSERPLAGAASMDASRLGRAPHDALQRLQDGHRRFLSAATPLGDISLARRRQLRSGQKPSAVVLTCADSRVAPELLFDAGLGELFVVRVAGNVLNEDVVASIEYAVAHTGASLVLVLGHTHCGAVTAATTAGDHGHGDLGPNLDQLVADIAPAVQLAREGGVEGEMLIDRAIEFNVQMVLSGLRQQSKVVQDLERTGRLAEIGAVYQLDTGGLKWLDTNERATAAPQAAPPAAPPAGHGHGR